MENYSVDRPVYALATAYAPSALAVIRTSGKDAVALLSAVFSSPKRLLNAQAKTLVHGWLTDRNGEKVDEVVLSVYRDGTGYTGQEAVEISCHGSLTTIRKIFILLEQAGFSPAQRGEFTFRAFMNGRMDLTQAEAVEEIIGSRSFVSQHNAIERLEGRLRDRLLALKDRLLAILASLEVQLDYAEDEILDDWVFPEEEVCSILSTLRTLAGTYNSGKIYREGAKVVLAGAANAGKSSLFNLLVKEERAIVSSVPGTTRDFIETAVDIAGIPVRLYDTAGLRSSDDEIESEGIRRSEDLMEKADLVIYLVDPEENSRPSFDADERVLVVYSKRDRKRVEGDLSVSSVTGEGVDELIKVVASRLAGASSQQESDLVIDSKRQQGYLEACIDCLEKAGHNRDASVDVMAMFFQEALENLGYITGEVTNDELLETLFSSFCLGK